MARRRRQQGMPRVQVKARWNCRECWEEFDSVALRNQHEADKHGEEK